MYQNQKQRAELAEQQFKTVAQKLERIEEAARTVVGDYDHSEFTVTLDLINELERCLPEYDDT